MYTPPLSGQRIIRERLRKAQEPLKKYHEPFAQDTEELTGEPNDRTNADAGVEMEPLEAETD